MASEYGSIELRTLNSQRDRTSKISRVTEVGTHLSQNGPPSREGHSHANIFCVVPGQLRRLFDNPVSKHINSDEEAAVQSQGLCTAFLYTIQGSGKETSLYGEWYTRFLKKQVRGLSPAVLQCLPGPTRITHAATDDQIFRCLNHIATMIRRDRNLPLAQIRDSLEEQHLVDIRKDHISVTTQFIFIAFGLLTMFYTPILRPTTATLEIGVRKDISEKQLTSYTWPVRTLATDSEVLDEPLHRLLRHFGNFSGPIPQAELLHDSSVTSPSLVSSNLNFYTLFCLADIQVIWTSSACEHLEFDVRNKHLKLFCYPSFCALMCTSSSTYEGLRANRKSQDAFLSQLLGDYFHQQDADDVDMIRDSQTSSAIQLYKEILESFRLIFGQDRHSQQVFNKSKLRKDLFESGEVFEDPLLVKLCGQDWTKQSVFTDINSGSVKAVYSAFVDFPHFADRLTALHDHVLVQQPNDWKSLWRDRRDIARFWTLWAALIFGIITIILAILQIGLGIAQVVAGFQAAARG